MTATLARWVRVDGQAVRIGRAAAPPAGLLYRARASSLALADGAAVASWPLDVGGLTLTQGTAGSRPAYLAAGLHGRPAVRFDGTDDFLVSSAAMAARAQPVTLAVVYRPSDVAAQKQLLHLGGVELLEDADERPQLWAGSVLQASTAVSSTAGGLVIATVTGASSTLHVNGVLVAAGDVGSGGITATTLAVGYHPSASGRNFGGDLYEFLVYDHALSADERSALGSYVRSAYRLAIDEGATATYPAAYPATY